jgi:hypothetical protein
MIVTPRDASVGSGTSKPEGVELLALLDDLVKSDPHGPGDGLHGQIGIGVETPPGTWVWWSATFGQEVRCGPVLRCPGDADALLFLGDLSARALLRSQRLPREAYTHFVGDIDLFHRFLERYVDARLASDVRSSRRSKP